MPSKQASIMKIALNTSFSNISHGATPETERTLLNAWASLSHNGNRPVPVGASSDFSRLLAVELPARMSHRFGKDIQYDDSRDRQYGWSMCQYHRQRMSASPVPSPLAVVPTESPWIPKLGAGTVSRASEITNTPKYYTCATSLSPYGPASLPQPARISIETSRHDYADILDLYKPVTQLHEPAFNTRAGAEESSSLEYLRCSLPIEQLDVCTVWKGLSLGTAEVLFEMQRAFLPSLEDILATQLEQLDRKERMECSPFRSALDGDRASLKRVGFSLSHLIDLMLDRIELQNYNEGDRPIVEFLMELLYLFFISRDCLVNLETYNYTDTAINIRLLPGENLPSDLVPPPVAHLMQELDYLAFSELDLLPREGQQLRIVPFYRCGARAKSNKKDTQISYVIASPTPWLTWDAKLCGFRGRIPMFSECRALKGRPSNVIDLGREGPYAVVNLLRIEIHAILTERHSLSTVQLKRTVRARVNLKVIPWYAHRSSQILRTLPYGRSSSVASSYNSRDDTPANEDFWTKEPSQKKKLFGRYPLHNTSGNKTLTLTTTTPPVVSHMSHDHHPWKSFDSNDYNVSAIFQAHRQYYKENTIPGSPRKDIDEHFGLRPSENIPDYHDHSRQGIQTYSVKPEPRQARRKNYGSLGAMEGRCPIDQLHWQDGLEFDDKFFDRFESGERDQYAQRPSTELTRLVQGQVEGRSTSLNAVNDEPHGTMSLNCQQPAIDKNSNENVSSENGEASGVDGGSTDFSPEPAVHQGGNTSSNTPDLPPLPRVICFFNRYSPLRNLRETSSSSLSADGSPVNRRTVSYVEVLSEDDPLTYDHIEYAESPLEIISPGGEADSEREVPITGCNERKVDSGCYMDDEPEQPKYGTTPAGSPPHLQNTQLSKPQTRVLRVNYVIGEHARCIGSPSRIETVQHGGFEYADAANPWTAENPRQQGQSTTPTVPANNETAIDYLLDIASREDNAPHSSPGSQSNGAVHSHRSPPSHVDPWQSEEISPSTSRETSSSLAIRVENDNVDPEFRRRQAVLWNILTTSAWVDDDGKGNKIKRSGEKVELGERWERLMGAEETRHRRWPSEETLGLGSTEDAEEESESGSDMVSMEEQPEVEDDDDDLEY